MKLPKIVFIDSFERRNKSCDYSQMIQKTKEGILKHQRQKSQDYLQKWDRYREKRYIEQDKYINFIKQSAKYRTIITWLKIR